MSSGANSQAGRVRDVTVAQASEPISHTFVNHGSTTLQLSWGDANYDTYHGPLEPGCRVVVGSYATTEWRVRDWSKGTELAKYSGPSATITINADGTISTERCPPGGAVAAGSSNTATPRAAASPTGEGADTAAAAGQGQKQEQQPLQATSHRFVNNTAEALELSWGDAFYDNHHGVLEPGKSTVVGAYTIHTWRVRNSSGAVVASVTGSSAVVTIGPDGVQTDQGGPASAPATASTSAASAASSGSTFHRFVNNTKEPLDLSWGDDHYDNHHGTVEPGKSVVVGTYELHTWRARSKTRGVVATYGGPSAAVTITPDGFSTDRISSPYATTTPTATGNGSNSSNSRSSDCAPGSGPGATLGAAAAAAATAAGALQAAAECYALRHKDVHTVEWNGQTSESTFHLFVNETQEPLDVSWGDEHYDTHYGVVPPGKNLFVGAYTLQQWRVRNGSKALLATYSGPSATITVHADGTVTTQRNELGGEDGEGEGGQRGAGGAYCKRANVLGMDVWAFNCVPDSAVCRLVAVVHSMLGSCPPAVLQRMVGAGAAFAVFGREQVVSDVPAHRFMRYNAGRCLNTTARGLGGTPAVPVTSCAEENLTMEGDGLYGSMSILVHEAGHAVLNMGMTQQDVEELCEAYTAAVQDQLYPSDCYMLTNEQEYWAVGVESWFESTMREDVNGGVRTRAALRAHDPRLAALLQRAFGDGAWRYHHDCPRPLSWHRSTVEDPEWVNNATGQQEEGGKAAGREMAAGAGGVVEEAEQAEEGTSFAKAGGEAGGGDVMVMGVAEAVHLAAPPSGNKGGAVGAGVGMEPRQVALEDQERNGVEVPVVTVAAAVPGVQGEWAGVRGARGESAAGGAAGK